MKHHGQDNTRYWTERAEAWPVRTYGSSRIALDLTRPAKSNTYTFRQGFTTKAKVGVIVQGNDRPRGNAYASAEVALKWADQSVDHALSLRLSAAALALLSLTLM